MLYLPETLVLNQPESDVNNYEESSNTCFCLGFTKVQSKIKMDIGEEYQDLLNAHLTAISWIEDNKGNIYSGDNASRANPYRDRIIKTCTLYIDRGGKIVQGHYQELKYYAQIVQRSPTSATDDRIEKKIRTENDFKTRFKSQGLQLHQEIIDQGLLRIEGFEDFKMNPNAEFFKKIKEVCLFNQSSEMNFIYAIAHKEKKYLDIVKNTVSLAAVPYELELGPFVKVLQESLGLVAFLCDVDSEYELTDSLFEYRGPVIISDVYNSNYTNKLIEIQDGSGTKEWEGRKQSKVLESGMDKDKLSKFSALESFMELQTTLTEEIKKK
ncbi:hypothetical protein EG339_06595 [Chryseobacterium bernardetii]|uniref:Uncharacterized protein n=1 Tax=Chryseobacterium bernardetii TaxID=1241978 RepID=A0A3G6TDZ2_9FLAO|nr:hypothetical protein [Chryseobacterium bernardetii]AZB24300.1 hypothetical protein EG339_06595 [Chryseobacterium bernardetii]